MSTWIIAATVVMFGLWWWLRRNRIVSENGVATLRKDDAEMARAIAKAREDFHLFAARLANPQPADENFAIKVGIEHDGNTEHLWLTDVRVDGDVIEGEIGNTPNFAPVKLGDRWRGTTAQLDQARAMLEERWDTRELVHLPWPRDAEMPGAPLPDRLSSGDSVLMEAVSDHLDATLGKGGDVFHELISPSAHIDLYPHPANATRTFHVVATTGAAEQAMQAPAGSAADVWVEFMLLLLPSTWPLDQAAWKDERFYWPLRWLKRVARHHYETGRWLGPGHLLLHGEPPTAIEASTRCDSVLLAPPAVLPEAMHSLKLRDGRSVRFLALYFLEPGERVVLEQHGAERFIRELASGRLSVPAG